MSSYEPGTPINLVERFWRIDPVTEVPSLADPTTVTFHVESPDGTVATYDYGVDGNVTRSSTGVYVCALPILDPGEYIYNCVGAGALSAESGDKTFEVLGSVFDESTSSIPQEGPCQPWISGDDVAQCLGVTDSDSVLYNDAAAQASSLMYLLSGRQFSGVCTRTVRPCSNSCGCWGDVSSGSGPWAWTSFYGGVSWGWRDEQGGHCGCNPLSEVKLSGYPIRSILEVKIDGVVLPQVDDNGDRNWRLDRNRRLVRMDSPVDGRRYWPGCQNLSLDDSEVGTFAVTYRWGQEPSSLGKSAAVAFAAEIYKACNGDASCRLPTKVTKVVRQGITFDRTTSIAQMIRSGSSGIQSLDTFIAASNPSGARRRPSVWTPDVQQYAREAG